MYTIKLLTLLDSCVSSLRRCHANLLCIVPTDDLRRESICYMYTIVHISGNTHFATCIQHTQAHTRAREHRVATLRLAYATHARHSSCRDLAR